MQASDVCLRMFFPLYCLGEISVGGVHPARFDYGVAYPVVCQHWRREPVAFVALKKIMAWRKLKTGDLTDGQADFSHNKTRLCSLVVPGPLTSGQKKSI